MSFLRRLVLGDGACCRSCSTIDVFFEAEGLFEARFFPSEVVVLVCGGVSLAIFFRAVVNFRVT